MELSSKFATAQELQDYLASTFGYPKSELSLDYKLDSLSIETVLHDFNPIKYAKQRNYGNGQVSRISHYIRHGIFSSRDVSNYILGQYSFSSAEKFIQEIYWRHFWQAYYTSHPEHIWESIENYKTGFNEDDYQDTLDLDIRQAKTANKIINLFIQELLDTGYLHNHARMYLAAYIVHYRRTKWQVGAEWFLKHLIDADIASNNLSFQWVASTFSRQAYIFNLDNVIKYFSHTHDIKPIDNPELAYSYAELKIKLFPNLCKN